MKTRTQPRIFTTPFAISAGESLSSSCQPGLWQCLYCRLVVWVGSADGGNPGSAGSWSPVTQLITSQRCFRQAGALGSVGHHWDPHGSEQLLNHGHLMPSEADEDVPALAFCSCCRRMPHSMPVIPQAPLGYPRKLTAYLFQTLLL